MRRANARGDGYPDDWIALAAPATPRMAQPAPGPQPSAPNPDIANRPGPLPDPFTAYWSQIPASHLRAVAWDPPIFPNALGQYPRPTPAPRTAPPVVPALGLLAGLANLQPATPEAALSSFGLLGGLALHPSNQPLGILGGLANLARSLPPAGLGGTSNASGGSQGFSPALAGLYPQADVSYGSGSRSLMPPDQIGYRGGSNANANAENDPLSFPGALRLASDRSGAASAEMIGGPNTSPPIAGSAEQVRPTPAQWYAPLIETLKPIIEGGADTLGARKLPVPELPKGMKNQQFGELARWGDGLQDAKPWAEQIARDPAYAKQLVDALQNAGVTKEMMGAWSRWYMDTFKIRGQNAPEQFRYRAEGLQQLFDQFPESNSTPPVAAPPAVAPGGGLEA
jgi:hypothetical protein